MLAEVFVGQDRVADDLPQDDWSLQDVLSHFHQLFLHFGYGLEAVLLVSMQQFHDYLAHVVAQDEVFEEIRHLVDVAIGLVLMQFVLRDVVRNRLGRCRPQQQLKHNGPK